MPPDQRPEDSLAPLVAGHIRLGEEMYVRGNDVATIETLLIRFHQLWLRRRTLLGSGTEDDWDSKHLNIAYYQDIPRILGPLHRAIEEMKETVNKLSDEVQKLDEVQMLDEVQAAVADPHLTVAEEASLRFVLERLGVKIGLGGLPAPRLLSGVEGKSRVFWFEASETGLRTPLLVKFDEPERAEQEWKVIRDLRLCSVPPEVILPHHGNEEADGVLIYPAAGTMEIPDVVRFSTHLGEILRSNPANCVACLELVLHPLKEFHFLFRREFGGKPHSERDWPWCDFFFHKFKGQEATLRDEMKGYAERACAEIDWSGTTLLARNPEGQSADIFIRRENPLKKLADHLTHRTDRIRLARVHGDLNLTNILVCRDAKRNPFRIYLIDLAESKAEQPTAIDLARLEAEFWVETYLDEVRKTPEGEIAWLTDFVAICSYLDGQADAPRKWHTSFSCGAAYFIYHLRQFACKRLRQDDGGRGNYALEDYYACLYFTYLKMLRRPRYVDESPVAYRSRLALLGSVLVNQVLLDLRRGNYSAVGPASPARACPCREIVELKNYASTARPYE